MARACITCFRNLFATFPATVPPSELNLPLATSPIVPVVLGDEMRALEAQQILGREGFLVTAIRPPTVPAGTARLRLAFTAAHPEGEVARLASVIRERIL